MKKPRYQFKLPVIVYKRRRKSFKELRDLLPIVFEPGECFRQLKKA